MSEHQLTFGLTDKQERAIQISRMYNRWLFMSMKTPLTWDQAIEDYQDHHGFQFNEDDLAEFLLKFGNRYPAWGMSQALYDFALRKGYLGGR